MRRSGVPVKSWKVASGPLRCGDAIHASCSDSASDAWAGLSGVVLKSPVSTTGTSAGSACTRCRISLAPRVRASSSSSR